MNTESETRLGVSWPICVGNVVDQDGDVSFTITDDYTELCAYLNADERRKLIAHLRHLTPDEDETSEHRG